MPTKKTPHTRRARGLAKFHEVYGVDAPLPEGGTAEFFDLLILDQQFAEVWSREALPIPMRRLLTMGVLAATRRFDILEIQFARALETGELNEEQAHEVVIHLTSYVGTPSSGGLYGAATAGIRAHRARRAKSGRSTKTAKISKNANAVNAAAPGKARKAAGGKR